MGDLILFPQKEMGNIKRGTLMVNDFNNIDTYPDLIDYLKDNTVQQFSKKEAEKLADKILQIGDYFDVVAPTPIVNITKQFGFYVFKRVIQAPLLPLQFYKALFCALHQGFSQHYK